MIDPARPHAIAEAHLASVDPVMARLIQTHGPCLLTSRGNGFAVLVVMIIGQQISTAAARTIAARVAKLVEPDEVTAESLHRFDDDAWKSCGLSAPKRRTIRGLVDRVREEPDFFERLENAPDDWACAMMLRSIRGIGPWTVHMYQIFAMGRPDIWPTGDLGLRLAVRDEYGLAEVPAIAELEKMSLPLAPHRTIATWYLWRSRGFIPQSGMEEEKRV